MSISYQTATPADAASFARCQIEAFMEDKLYQAAFGLTPNSPSEQVQENIDYRIKRYQRRLKHPHIHWIKAVDDSTGAIVGISGWEEPESRWTKDFGDEDEEELKWPSSWDKKFLEHFNFMEEKLIKANLGEAKDLWHVAMMAVLHSHRRLGIAHGLVMRGVELADKAGEGIYLEDTAVAMKIYERNGFKAVAEYVLPEGYRTNIMLRKGKE